MYKRHFCKDKQIVLVWRETGVVFSVFRFPVGPHVLWHSTEKEAGSIGVMKATMIMITHNMACLWERMQRLCVCLKVYVNVFFSFLIKIVLYKIAPSFHLMFFLKTHNANQLKCCCNGLTFLLSTPRIDPSASIVVQFPPYFHILKYEHVFLTPVIFLFLLISPIRGNVVIWILLWGEWDVLSLSDLFCLRSWMLNVFCTVMLLALFCTSWEGAE